MNLNCSLFALIVWFGIALLPSCAVAPGVNQQAGQVSSPMPADTPDENGLSRVTKEDLERSMSLWKTKRSRRYEYTLITRLSGFNPVPKLQIKVDGEEPISIEYVDIKGPADPIHYNGTKTVDLLFELINKASDTADEVRCRFNPEFGYPEELLIDDNRRTRGAQSFSVQNLRFQDDEQKK